MCIVVTTLLYIQCTSSMHNMFGASVSEVYDIIWCQLDLKIDNLIHICQIAILG